MQYYEKSHRIINFNPGDLVLSKFPFLHIEKSPKLTQKYWSSFIISEKITNLNYKVKIKLNNILIENIIHVSC